MLQKSVVFLLVWQLIACAVKPAAAQEFRTWRDSSGKFSLEATLLEEAGGNVVLQSRDGRKVTVPIEKLSEQDRNFLAAMDSPTGESSAPTVTLENDRGPTVLGITPKWSFQIAPQSPVSPGQQRVVSLPQRKSVVETFAITAINPVAGRALISSVYSELRGGGPQTTRLQLLDYAAGELIYESSLEGAWKPLALSDNASQVLLTDIPKQGDPEEGKLMLANLENGSVTVECEWVPFGDIAAPTDEELLAELKQREPTMSPAEQMRLKAMLRSPSESGRSSSLNHFRPPASKPIRFAEFAGEDRVVTLNSNGILRFWQLSDQTLLRELQYPESCEAELSPDRQHLALASFSSVALINVKQPDQFAMQSLPGRHGSVRLAFSPSGQRLVVSPINEVYVLEVGTGEVIHSGSLHLAGVNRAIKLVSEDMLLVDHAFLYDFKSQTFPWIFPDATCHMAGGLALWMASRKPSSVIIDRLPSADVSRQLENFVMSPDFQIIKPGFEARVDVTDVPDPLRQDIQQKIENVIRKAGGKPVPDSGLVIKCSVNPPRTRRLAYMFTGTHDVPVIECGVSLLVDGDERWRHTWDNVPEAVERLTREETTARLIEICKRPDLSRFASEYALPKRLQRTPVGPPVNKSVNAFGRSRLTDQGWHNE